MSNFIKNYIVAHTVLIHWLLTQPSISAFTYNQPTIDLVRFSSSRNYGLRARS